MLLFLGKCGKMTLFRGKVEQKELTHKVGYLFSFFKEANGNKDDVIITDFSEESVTIRVEFQKKGIFRIEDNKEQS